MNFNANRTIGVLAILSVICTTNSVGKEIGFIEDFSLAIDRSVALSQLIPGTDDYYYFHCLNAQSNEKFDEVSSLLKAWEKTRGSNQFSRMPQVREIRHRQALLTYSRNTKQTLDYLKRELNLRFDHQRERLNGESKLPSQLSDDDIRRESFRREALRRHNNLDGFTENAFQWLAKEKLSADQRRDLLGRLSTPDYDSLVEMIDMDLRHKGSRGFGSLPIHHRLTLRQLNGLLDRQPALRNDSNFINTYLIRLLPDADAIANTNLVENRSYLDRVWEFVKTLPPARNSLKANILYQILKSDIAEQSHSKKRLLEYLALPRPLPYVNTDFLRDRENRRYPVDLSADYSKLTRTSPIGSDEQLVREYLEHFFVTASNYKDFEPFVRSEYLKQLFAEVKLLHGLGDAERWYAMLSPERVQALKDRVEIEFDPANRKRFDVADPIHLSVHTKNITKLLVKVYRINAVNYYQQTKREINTDINLDGLVAKDEQTYTYEDAPVRRVKRQFQFPQLDRAGTYVVDFIGNGISSRALIRKGSLRYFARMTNAGQLVTMLDDSNQMVKDGRLWMAGREYLPDSEGRILVPFATQSRTEMIVLKHGDVASLKTFLHHGEEYSLNTGFYVDRESLLAGNRASIIVRPGLYLNGTPISRTLLRDIRLTISSTDDDGIMSNETVTDLEVSDTAELVHEVRVPDRTRTLSVRFDARVQRQTTGKDVELSSHDSYTINEIDNSSAIEMANLVRSKAGYSVELVGKSGEPFAGRPVVFQLKHREFTDPLSVTLQSDAAGVVTLGSLPEIESISAKTSTGGQFDWTLRRNAHSYPRTIHAQSGESIEVPLSNLGDTVSAETYALFELRGNALTVDRFAAMSAKDGALQIQGLEAGDYQLHIKESGEQIHLRVTNGEPSDGFLVGESRILEQRRDAQLTITTTSLDADELVVQLANANQATRVHLFATRYQPAFDSFARLSVVRDSEPMFYHHRMTSSLFVEGRKLGDEMQYVLNRRFLKKYPGNMLDRPELLLNPWAVRDTATTRDDAEDGDAFDAQPDSDQDAASRALARDQLRRKRGEFANLDFLSQGSVVVLNLKPDDSGIVRIPISEFEKTQQVSIVAVNNRTTTSATIALPHTDLDRTDLRLADALPVDKPFSRQRRIEFADAGETFQLPSTSIPKIELFDSIESVYFMYETLSNNDTLRKFRFIVGWEDLTGEQKREKYSEFACHELNFYLYKKDKEFFSSVIQPYLENKFHKTFLDKWLLQSDLSAFLDPWRFSQLNTFERILLAGRFDDQHDAITRLISDEFERLPVDHETLDRFMGIALKHAALDKASRGAESRKDLALFSNAAAAPVRAATAVPQAAARPGLSRKRRAMDRKAESAAESVTLGDKVVDEAGLADGIYAGKLAEIRQHYRPIDTTREWAENNYYQLPIDQQNNQLIRINPFWMDFARHTSDSGFYSPHFAHATNNFTEMMMALAVLDLSTKSTKPEAKFAKNEVSVQSEAPLLIAYESIRPAESAEPDSAILVSQNFYRVDDRYRTVGNQRFDKFVTDEFVRQVVYGCQIVITNSTSSRQKLSGLLQLPAGSVPVSGAHYTRSQTITLEPYRTETVEYHFYFPESGKFSHYPVHVNRDDIAVASATPFQFNVVDKATVVDRHSWRYISQHGENSDVLEFLRKENLHDVALHRIAFRMSDRAFFDAVISVMKDRQRYDHTLWSYAILHDHENSIKEYLLHAPAFIQQCGMRLHSDLLMIDPVEQGTYQHLEYHPLVNARTHLLGNRRKILNDRFHAQYHRWLKSVSYQRSLTDADCLAATYYLLLQDRIEDAWTWFERINPEGLSSKVQYDYATAYLDFFTINQERARRIADKYADYPVDRWRRLFANVSNQLTELDGGAINLANDLDRNQQNAQLAATDASFDLSVDGRKVKLSYRNISKVTLNYYLMDIELLFSRSPFVTGYSNQFSFIEPNISSDLSLPSDKSELEIVVPEELDNTNVLIEVSGHGQTQAKSFFSNSMNVFIQQNYGQLQVNTNDHQPLPKTYVKVYAEMEGGNVLFYKDGYTDLRGRFDYSSLSTNQLTRVKRFSLLVMSEQNGAVVREALPPKR